MSEAILLLHVCSSESPLPRTPQLGGEEEGRRGGGGGGGGGSRVRRWKREKGESGRDEKVMYTCLKAPHRMVGCIHVYSGTSDKGHSE